MVCPQVEVALPMYSFVPAVRELVTDANFDCSEEGIVSLSCSGVALYLSARSECKPWTTPMLPFLLSSYEAKASSPTVVIVR